ncbi:TraR/DksA family transcriptional regulator [Vulgatibacter incomptus]|uniref:C4-type zinc finger protein, DksA/TraR family n=1 Tax=Vulgatibacter incomptus TaxID=1391653 RepID=A0A0K1PCB1_9BACT|nr:TraR/DksA C4-type zinc finger protein [Vulgatibacter incomptus]AKU90739.1 C4-type zinc finger protein, DksA/TraR family [Vulgatibacter incomptus]
MTYDRHTLERMRQRLLERRYVVVRSTIGNQREIAELKGQQRTAEMEEDAQTSSAEFVLTRLSENQRREVGQIDAAVARIDAGTYGECIDCGETIPIERLEAVPYALRDSECTRRREAMAEPGREYPTL